MKSQGKSKKSQGEIQELIGGLVYYHIKREVSASLFLFESFEAIMKFCLIQNPKDSTKIAVGETDGLKIIIKIKHCNPHDLTK